MQHTHFPVRDIKDVTLTAIGATEDGYDCIELNGAAVITSDNLVFLGLFFMNLGSVILGELAEIVGIETVEEELAQIRAGLPFQEPEPEVPPTLPFPEGTAPVVDLPSAPDIEGRDL